MMRARVIERTIAQVSVERRLRVAMRCAPEIVGSVHEIREASAAEILK
jgi:hypothetical protein